MGRHEPAPCRLLEEQSLRSRSNRSLGQAPITRCPTEAVIFHPQARDARRGSSAIKPIDIHYLGPGRHEVVHELLMCIVTAIDFGNGTQLGV